MDEAATGNLVRRASRGDEQAFSLLVTRYSRPLFYTALSMLHDYCAAEDIVQEVFLKAYSSLDELREPEKVGAWLAAMTRNKAISHIRKQRSHPVLSLEGEDNIGSPEEADPSEVEAASVERRKLLGRISILPEVQQRLLMLKYLDKMSVEDIAAIEQLTEASVRNHLYRARKLLREMMENERQV
ncbi:MAG: sigma-70 family RNA polymerase sigma factor [Candidatus Brocadiia bacterium]